MYGKYEERPDDKVPDELEAFGFNRMHPKAAFINQDKIHYRDMGEQLGRFLGRSEDKCLCEWFIKYLPMTETNIDLLENTIYNNLNKLREKKSNPILIYNKRHIHLLNKSKYYKPKWKIDFHELKDIDRFNGTFDGIAIIDVRELSNQDILLIDFSHFAKLVQYRVEKESEYPLSITIEQIDENAADKLIIDQPSFLIDKDEDKKTEKETVIRDLRQRVHLQIWETFGLEDINLNEGVRIRIEK